MLVAAAMGAVHLTFAVESMGGLSSTVQQLLREIQLCEQRLLVAGLLHLVDSIVIVVQCCNGMVLRASADREMQTALGAEAA